MDFYSLDGQLASGPSSRKPPMFYTRHSWTPPLTVFLPPNSGTKDNPIFCCP